MPVSRASTEALFCLCAIIDRENEPNLKVYEDAFPSLIR